MKAKWIVGMAVLLWTTVAWADNPFYIYTTVRKTATGTGNSTAQTLWTPTSGSRFILQGCVFSSASANSFRLQVSGVDIIPPQYVTSLGSVQVGGTTYPVHVSAKDDVLTYTVSNTIVSATSDAWSIVCWGAEEVF